MDQASPALALTCPLRYNSSGGASSTEGLLREGEMEEKDVLQELQAIRRFVRQTWIMMIVLLVVIVVPTVLVGCMTAGVILVEFLPH